MEDEIADLVVRSVQLREDLGGGLPDGLEQRRILPADLREERVADGQAGAGEAATGQRASSAPSSLEDIADPGLRELLSGLKIAIEGGRKDGGAGGREPAGG